MGPARQVGQVGEQPRGIGVIGRERAGDHGLGGLERDDRPGDGLAVVGW